MTPGVDGLLFIEMTLINADSRIPQSPFDVNEIGKSALSVCSPSKITYEPDMLLESGKADRAFQFAVQQKRPEICKFLLSQNPNQADQEDVYHQ